MELRGRLLSLLHDESELEEVVKLIGMDALSPVDTLKMEAAQSIREDFLHQLAFHEVDTYTSLKKQHLMMKAILSYYDMSVEALEKGADIEKVVNIPVRERIGRLKYVPEDEIEDKYASVMEQLARELNALSAKEEEY